MWHLFDIIGPLSVLGFFRLGRFLLRAFTLASAALTAATLPVCSQPLTKAECDEFVSGITEISRAAAGMLVHVENMNTATLKSGSDKVTIPVTHLDEARKLLVVALSEFTLAAKEVGKAVSDEVCP